MGKLSKKSQRLIIQGIVFVSLIVSGLFAIASINESTKVLIEEFIQNNTAYSYLLITLLSFIATIIPPISTAIISILAIQYFGWEQVLLFATIGNMAGYILDFYIARRFRKKISELFKEVRDIHRWENKHTQTSELFFLLPIRIATYVVGDYMSYALGISNVSFRVFFTTTFIAEVVSQTVIFYLAHLGYTISPVWFATLLIPFGLSYFAYREILLKSK